ncbi:hypothetical protein ACKTEK_10155 [Tepidamorphus sp. 3E244]|uniref:hypothetical protein n=1 Tax=Tepidamorphus sp. 3E244 TaxID=3385498 RepID=UPI0038FC0DA1
MEAKTKSGRGALFFNFGTGYALRLFVALHSLRKYYDGPITLLLLEDDADAPAVAETAAKLSVDCIFVKDLSRSESRHEILKASPYATTLSFDSDLLFRGPIDPLWGPLEREGLLVTRVEFHSLDDDGLPTKEGPKKRAEFLQEVEPIVGKEAVAEAVRKIYEESTDINIGVLGLSLPKGQAFFDDYSRCMEQGRGQDIVVLDELLTVALVTRHGHALMDESWNCPADEYFRTIGLLDAKVIHYFIDGWRLCGVRHGRNPSSWSGRMWYRAYEEAARDIDLRRWRRADVSFASATDRYFAHGFDHGISETFKRLERKVRHARYRLTGQTHKLRPQ